MVFSSKDEDMCSADETLLEGVEDESRYSWLLHHLPNIPHFEFVRPSVIVALRAALLVETQPNVVASYLKFLSSYALDGPLQDLADLTLVSILQDFLAFLQYQYFFFFCIFLGFGAAHS